MCRTGSNPSVKTYRNNDIGYFSSVLDAANPSIGLANTMISTDGNNVTCIYERQNVADKQNYLQITPATGGLYILSAFGAGEVSNHGNNKDLTSMAFNFFTGSTNETTTQSPIINPGNFLEYLYDLIKAFFEWFLSLFM